MDKNNDLLYRDLSQCLYACGHPLAKTLFPEGKGVIEIYYRKIHYLTKEFLVKFHIVLVFKSRNSIWP